MQLKYLTICDIEIINGGEQNAQTNGTFMCQVEYERFLNPIQKLLNNSIEISKANLFRKQTIELKHSEIERLKQELDSEISMRIESLKKVGLSGYGNIFTFKNKRIRLTSSIRHELETVTGKLIRLFNFCDECLINKRNIYFNVTIGYPWKTNEKNEV
jgi:hypothetical protein